MARLTWLYRPWWLLLDGVRMLVRAGVETRRNSLIWPAAMMFRWVAHVTVLAPWLVVWLLFLLVVGVTRSTVVYGLIVCVAAELAVQLARWSCHSIAVGFWTYRRARSVHRRWPRAWGDYAGRTNKVQAATGAEPSTPVRWRPLVDHPRLSWLYLPTNPGTVEFLVGPPPDRTYADLVTATAALAAKFSYVESIEVDYHSDRSSLAVLTITFTVRQPSDQRAPRLRLVPELDDREVAS